MVSTFRRSNRPLALTVERRARPQISYNFASVSRMVCTVLGLRARVLRADDVIFRVTCLKRGLLATSQTSVAVTSQVDLGQDVIGSTPQGRFASSVLKLEQNVYWPVATEPRDPFMSHPDKN